MPDYTQLSEQELTVECWQRLYPWRSVVTPGPLRDEHYWQMLDELPDGSLIGNQIVAKSRSAAFKRAIMIAYLQYKETKG